MHIFTFQLVFCRCFFFQHLQIYCNRRKMMIIKPGCSWKYDYLGCCFKINNLSHTVTFHSELSQLEQESIILCSDAARFSRAVRAQNLPQRVGILIRNQKCKVWRCKLVCIEWINNKVLLHRTGNYIHNYIML